MRRTLRSAFGIGALASGLVLGLVVSATHAQAPVRPVSGSHFSYASTRTPALPASAATTAAATASAGAYYYPSAAPATAVATAPASDYYYPSRDAASAPSNYYYPAPAAGNPARNYYYYSNPATPAPGRRGPVDPQRYRPLPPSGYDEDYAYKS